MKVRKRNKQHVSAGTCCETRNTNSQDKTATTSSLVIESISSKINITTRHCLKSFSSSNPSVVLLPFPTKRKDLCFPVSQTIQSNAQLQFQQQQRRMNYAHSNKILIQYKPSFLLHPNDSNPCIEIDEL